MPPWTLILPEPKAKKICDGHIFSSYCFAFLKMRRPVDILLVHWIVPEKYKSMKTADCFAAPENPFSGFFMPA